MGNICRSPAAEGVFRHQVSSAGRDAEFEIDSAGTHSYHIGHPADSRMRSAAAARGFSLDSIARRIDPADFERFDWIVTMDDHNLSLVSAMDTGAGARVVRMVDYSEGFEVDEVPDPYYGGPEGFEFVLDMLEDACARFLRQF